MTLHRFFVTGDLDGEAAECVELGLSETDRHHLSRVLRLVPGDRIVVADPGGREATATLVTVSGDAVVADLDAPIARPRAPRIVLAPGLSRRERMEFTVQKATELGVDEIWPLVTERCVVRLDEERAGKRVERWQRIAEEAAKQSQRSEVPALREPMTISELAAEAGRFDIVLVPWEDAGADGAGIGHVLDEAGATPDTTVLLVIGPEGGLTESEVDALTAAGAGVVTLGATVLRTETAAIVAVALTAYELGALGGRAR
jgi:16S rRNA (uracil1498-N3)-methyltransferase